MSAFREAAALEFDPWAGEMDSDAITMRDAFVTVRVSHCCAICFDTIPAGSRVRAQTQRSEEQRKVMTFRFCPACCAAMAEAVRDGAASRTIDKYYALGEQRARARRAVR